MTTIAAKFEEFHKTVYPSLAADAVQMEHIRRAFYCGSLETFSTIETTCDMPEKEGIEQLATLRKEVEEWIRGDVARELRRVTGGRH